MTKATDDMTLDLEAITEGLPHYMQDEGYLTEDLIDKMIEEYALERARCRARLDMYVWAQQKAQAAEVVTRRLRVNGKTQEPEYNEADAAWVQANKDFEAVKAALGVTT